MELLGIDYGTKRVGLSHADTLLRIAFTLPALTQPTEPARLDALEAVIRQYRPSALVVGYPYHMDGRISAKAREVDLFIKKLEARFQLPVHRMDERLSSAQAQLHLNLTQKKPKTLKATQSLRKDGSLDSHAAQIILQDFLDEKESKGPPAARDASLDP